MSVHLYRYYLSFNSNETSVNNCLSKARKSSWFAKSQLSDICVSTAAGKLDVNSL